MHSESKAPASTATGTAARGQPERIRASANRKPSGP